MQSPLRLPATDNHQSPFLVIWETTQACDLACRHCRASAQPEHDPLALDTAEARELLRQIRSFGTPPPLMVFTGGDPFKRRDLFELIAYAVELGLHPGVSPSATPLLTRENLLKVREAGARTMSLSLDASTASAHDAFRGVPGSFELTMRGARLARELGLKLQVNTTVTRHNLRDLPALVELLAPLELMSWSAFFLVPTGRGQTSDSISAEECESAMHFLVDASRYLPVKTTEGHHYKRVLTQRQTAPAPDTPLYRELVSDLEPRARGWQPRAAARRKPLHINSGDGFVFISHRGHVFPSGFLPLAAGNVRTQGLVDIYRESPLFQAMRGELEGRCGACEYRSICGGSRSRAYAMSGNPRGEDPLCAYQPEALCHAF